MARPYIDHTITQVVADHGHGATGRHEYRELTVFHGPATTALETNHDDDNGDETDRSFGSRVLKCPIYVPCDCVTNASVTAPTWQSMLVRQC
jgi:hypothetical protein